MTGRTRTAFGFLILILLLIWGVLLNLTVGSVSISVAQIWDILQTGPGAEMPEQIIWNVRMPRIVTAAVLGGALSVSGFLLQTFFANPIVGPYVLGISSGAKLAVALAMVFFLDHGLILHATGMVFAAFLGAIAAMGFILILSVRVRRISQLVVCGVMIGYICSAVTEFVVTFADDSNIINLHNWSMGSFSGKSWEDVRTILSFILIALILSIPMAKPMGAYQLGEVYAENVGVDLKRFRIALILLSTALSACVTAFAGPVSFVGIAVPHLARRLFRTATPLILLPACFLSGAVFCLFCDLMARMLFAPTELSISSVTAVFGAPIVIWMMGSRSRSDG